MIAVRFGISRSQAQLAIQKGNVGGLRWGVGMRRNSWRVCDGLFVWVVKTRYQTPEFESYIGSSSVSFNVFVWFEVVGD